MATRYEVPRAVLFGLIHNTHAAFENLADDFVPSVTLDGKQASHMRIFRINRGKSSLAKPDKKTVKTRAFLNFSTCAVGPRLFNTDKSQDNSPNPTI